MTKRLNNTAHQRAMASPEVQEALNDLRACWSDLSPQQRGERIKVLIGFKCSLRGIAKELGEHESTLRRYLALVNPPEEESDWIAQMKSTITKRPQKQGTEGADEEVSPLLAKIRARKIVGAATVESHPVKDDAHISTAQQAKKITSPESTAAKEPPVVNDVMSGQEDQAGEGTPKTNLVEAFFNMERIRRDKIQRLASLPDQIEARPLKDAGSMRRQGRQLPPKDRH